MVLNLFSALILHHCLVQIVIVSKICRFVDCLLTSCCAALSPNVSRAAAHRHEGLKGVPDAAARHPKSSVIQRDLFWGPSLTT